MLEENYHAASDPAFVTMLEHIQIGKATTVDWSLLLWWKLDTATIVKEDWDDTLWVTTDKVLRDK